MSSASMERNAAAAEADPCAICLGDIRRGQAIFTAECSHVFHHRCISDSVAHGNRDCPLCKATWRDVPAVGGVPSPMHDDPVPVPAPMYADDDPVEQTAVQVQEGDQQAAVVGEMSLKTHCEFPAVARDVARDNFAVLVHARAPEADAARAPLDLVTVLDVSGSMHGGKLALLKQAMGFVIDNLGAADRLSVVSFSHEAKREMRLTRMSGDGKASAKEAVDSLDADGGTDISKGLLVASEVLAGRRFRNAVTSVILLSDGQDNHVRRNYRNLVPPAFRDAGGSRPGPIHTFGFGSDHDAAAMHTIAELACGTFSFIENLEAIQDSFAQCIGGLLSVVAQQARIAVECVHPGVRVRQVKSGRYESSVDAEGRAAAVEVGELYAEEERRFLLFVDVPRAEASEDVTRLVKVRCTYRNVATGQEAVVVSDDAVVQRPAEVSDPEVSMEVERERARVAAAEDIAAARAAAERGAFQDAGMILDRQRCKLKSLQVSLPGMARDDMCEELEEELEDLEECMDDEVGYEKMGRARVLQRMSAHAQQRASYRSRPEGAPQKYSTTAMRSMLEKSQKTREKEGTSSPAPSKRKRGDSDPC